MCTFDKLSKLVLYFCQSNIRLEIIRDCKMRIFVNCAIGWPVPLTTTNTTPCPYVTQNLRVEEISVLGCFATGSAAVAARVSF